MQYGDETIGKGMNKSVYVRNMWICYEKGNKN